VPELLISLLPLPVALVSGSVLVLAEVSEADCSLAGEVTDKPECDRPLLGSLLWEL